MLTRAEKRDLKKQAEEKEGNEAEEDPDLINPNHVQQKLNISDLNTPRELSRRERYDRISLIFKHILIYFFREQKEKQEAKDKYWKVSFIYRYRDY